MSIAGMSVFPEPVVVHPIVRGASQAAE